MFVKFAGRWVNLRYVTFIDSWAEYADDEDNHSPILGYVIQFSFENDKRSKEKFTAYQKENFDGRWKEIELVLQHLQS